jgi:uncharacterized protein YndB with AHSA1/START domain
MSTSIEDVDGRPTIRLTRRLPRTVERVWRAVTDPAEMELWFVGPVPWTPVAGETFEAAGEQGRITRFEPPTSIAWEWGDELYSIELRADGDGCELVFLHGFTTVYGPGDQHAAGWEIYFGRLESHLLGNFVDELDAHSQAVYVTEGDRPVVRFHRRLDHPISRVWRSVTEPAELASWFPCSVQLEELRADAEMTFDFAPDFQLSGEVLRVEPPRLFEFRWGDDTIRIELLSVGDGKATLLSFTHVIFEDADTVARNAAGWHVCLDALARKLDDPGAATVEPGRTPEWEALYDAYIARGYPAGAAIPAG